VLVHPGSHLNPGFSQIFMKSCRLESGPKVQTIFATYNKRRQKKKNKVTLWDLASSSLLPLFYFGTCFVWMYLLLQGDSSLLCVQTFNLLPGGGCVCWPHWGRWRWVGPLYDAILFLGGHPFSRINSFKPLNSIMH
jgi:hypothetical protein